MKISSLFGSRIHMKFDIKSRHVSQPASYLYEMYDCINAFLKAPTEGALLLSDVWCRSKLFFYQALGTSDRSQRFVDV